MVHPRMRGEHVALHYVPAAGYGSSPHARGTRLMPRAAYLARPVHPRMRGEHCVRPISAYFVCGSSPHARGTPFWAPGPHRQVWFIPACAGNTCRGLVAGMVSSVHPRMRGEHASVANLWTCPAGSSPHARGTLSRAGRGSTVRRFIPACAGNTADRRAACWGQLVHPRMRGEHSMPGPCSMACTGSSPHARGTRAPIRGFLGSCRFIPACAGNTAGPCCRWV